MSSFSDDTEADFPVVQESRLERDTSLSKSTCIGGKKSLMCMFGKNSFNMYMCGRNYLICTCIGGLQEFYNVWW